MNIPSWVFRTYETVLLFVMASSFLARLTVGPPISRGNVDMYKYGAFVGYLSFVIVLGFFGMPQRILLQNDLARSYIMIGLQGLLLLTFFGCLAHPRLRPHLKGIGFALPFVIGILMALVSELRIMFPSLFNPSDIGLLLALYMAIQIFITNIYVEFGFVGQYVHGSNILFIGTILVFLMCLPIAIIREALTMPDELWMQHDFGNINIANGVFGLATTGFMLAVKGLASIKKSMEEAQKAIKMHQPVINKAKRYIEAMEDESILEPGYFHTEVKEFIADSFNAAASQLAVLSEIPFKCIFFNSAPIDRLVVNEPDVPESPVVTTSTLCSAATKNPSNFKVCGFELKCEETDDLPTRLLVDLKQLIKASQVMIDSSKRLSVDYRYASKVVAAVSKDHIVAQLLVATGFYGAIYGVASVVRANRKDVGNSILPIVSGTTAAALIFVFGWVVYSAFWAGRDTWKEARTTKKSAAEDLAKESEEKLAPEDVSETADNVSNRPVHRESTMDPKFRNSIRTAVDAALAENSGDRSTPNKSSHVPIQNNPDGQRVKVTISAKPENL